MKLKLYRPSAPLPKSEFVPVKRSSNQAPLPPAKVEQSMTRTGCTVTLANGTRIEFHGELSAVVIHSIMTAVSQVH